MKISCLRIKPSLCLMLTLVFTTVIYSESYPEDNHPLEGVFVTPVSDTSGDCAFSIDSRPGDDYFVIGGHYTGTFHEESFIDLPDSTPNASGFMSDDLFFSAMDIKQGIGMGYDFAATGDGHEVILDMSFDRQGNLLYGSEFIKDCNDPDPEFNSNPFYGVFPGEEPDLHTTVQSDVFITKILESGSYGWTRRTEGLLAKPSSFASMEEIVIDSQDNVYFTGYASGLIDFDSTVGGEDIRDFSGASGGGLFVTRYNSDGSYGWTYSLNDVGSGGEAIAINTDDQIVVVGSIFGVEVNFGTPQGLMQVPGSRGIFILTLDLNGLPQTAFIIGGSEPMSFQTVAGMSVGSNDTIVFTGYFNKTMEFSPVVLGHNSFKRTSVGQYDMYIIQYDKDFNIRAFSQYGVKGSHIYPYAISLNKCNEAIVVGDYGSSLAIPNIGRATTGKSDGFMIKVDKKGEHIWDKSFQVGDLDEKILAVKVIHDGTIVISGKATTWNPGVIDPPIYWAIAGFKDNEMLCDE